MRIDPKSNVPIFRQIADQLRRRVRRGVHKPGEMLPSLRALALEIGVNPNTIQRAYELLEREGVVESRRGVGIFVAAREQQPSTAAERNAKLHLTKLVSDSLDAGLSPDRLRALFEAALHDHLQAVQ